jgi:hypothetical protein
VNGSGRFRTASYGMNIPAHAGNTLGPGSPLLLYCTCWHRGRCPGRLETYQVAVLTPLMVKGIGDGSDG